MRKMTCALRHADWRTALCLGALLLTLWCPPGRTEHLGADYAWMAGVKGRGNEACCAVLDCVEATVALVDQNAMESTVMIGETVLTLPSAWVHPSRGPTGMWFLSHRRRQGGNLEPILMSRGGRGRSPHKRPRGRIPAAPFSSASIKPWSLSGRPGQTPSLQHRLAWRFGPGACLPLGQQSERLVAGRVPPWQGHVCSSRVRENAAQVHRSPHLWGDHEQER